MSSNNNNNLSNAIVDGARQTNGLLLDRLVEILHRSNIRFSMNDSKAHHAIHEHRYEYIDSITVDIERLINVLRENIQENDVLGLVIRNIKVSENSIYKSIPGIIRRHSIDIINSIFDSNGRSRVKFNSNESSDFDYDEEYLNFFVDPTTKKVNNINYKLLLDWLIRHQGKLPFNCDAIKTYFYINLGKYDNE